MCEEVLTPQQLADRWSVDPQALAMMRYRKRGPAYQKLGKTVRYLLADVEAFEDSARRSTEDQQ